MNFLLLIRLLQLVMTPLGVVGVYSQEQRRVEFNETLLGPMYQPIAYSVISPDGLHVAYIVDGRSHSTVVLDGKPQKDVPKVLPEMMRLSTPDGKPLAIETLLFSPDGKHLAYVAATEKKQWVVIDGRPVEMHDYIVPYSFVFSGNSNHYAFIAADGHKKNLIRDGKPSPQSYSAIGNPKFSPDGTRFAYEIELDGKWCVVILTGRLGSAIQMSSIYRSALMGHG